MNHHLQLRQVGLVEAFWLSCLLSAATGLVGCATDTPGVASSDQTTDKQAAPSPATAYHEKSDTMPVGMSPTLGDPESPLTVTLVVDPLEPEVPSLLRRVETARHLYDHGTVRVALHFAPGEVHPGSDLVSKLLLAAHRQGRFTRTWRRLLQSYSELSRAASSKEVRSIIEPSVEQLGVSVDRRGFSDAVRSALEADRELVEALKIDETPAVYLNGSKSDATFDGRTLAGILRDVDDTLYRLRVKQGLARREVYAASVAKRYNEPYQRHARSHSVEYVEVRRQDPVVGQRRDAAVTVVAYVQYRNPLTRSFAEMAAALVQRHPHDVRIVFKPVPRPDGPPIAARTALAASRIDAFEPVHEALLTNRGPLSSEKEAASLVESAGVDVEAWRRAFNSEAVSHHLWVIANDTGAYHRLPALYLNGIKLEGVPTYLTLAELTRQQATITVPQRFRRSDVTRYRAAVEYNAQQRDDD